MAYEVVYWPAADDALSALEKDPALAPALQAVERILLELEADPFNPRLGTTAFMTEDYGGVSAAKRWFGQDKPLEASERFCR